MLNYTLGITESVNKIFAGVLIGAINRDNESFNNIIMAAKVNRNKFIAYFPSNIFQDEFAIFYDIIVKLNAKVFTINELEAVVDNNRDLILDSPYVDLSKMATTQSGTQSTDDEKIEAVKANLVDKFIELSNRYVSEDEFDSSCAIFIDWFKKQYMLQVSQAMARIMSDQGYDEKKPGKRSRHYYGFDDCRAYYNENMKILNELSQTDRVRSLVVDKEWLEQDLQAENLEDKNALMTIGIPEIDEVLGELRRGNMLGVLGPPKGGKTRFVNFIVSRALSLGLNVCVWTLEGTKEEWIAMQLAALIRRENNVAYNSKDILQRRFNSKDPNSEKLDKSIVNAAKMKLSTDHSMGKLSFIESTAYVEDFMDMLEAHYENENPFDIIVIDQLIDILSRTGRGKVERISQAYQELKLFISTRMKRPALALIPAQLKQDTVDFLRRNPGETIDVTAGGESAETIRTPDEVIGLFSSKEERASNQMHIYSVASRHSGNFPDFRIKAELKCCHFYSDPTLNQ